jgi:hypothetical protein
MKMLVLLSLVMLGITGFTLTPSAGAADSETWNLPKPVTQGGKPLMEALSQRQSNRNFSDKPVADQTLSDLLWAAWGINRPDGKHTAPTAMNKQEVMVFAAMENGVWLYEPSDNTLTKVLPDDTRKTFGGAPLGLLYAAPASSDTSSLHIGSLYQNAGLYCASVGLANVVKSTGRDALDGKLALPRGYKVFIVHSIGWPR